MTRLCTIFSVVTLFSSWPGAALSRPLSSSDIQDRVEGVHDAEVLVTDWVIADFNGDGHGDLAMSHTLPGEGSQVVVTSGADLPWGIMVASPEMAAVVIQANMPMEEFGASLAAGDVTGDGFPDLVVGAPGAVNPGYEGTDLYDAGRIYVYPGGDMTSWTGTPFSTILGDREGMRLGEKVAVGPLLGNVAKEEVIACAPGYEVDEYPGAHGALLVWEDLPGNVGMAGTAIKLLGDGLVCTALAAGPDMVGDAAPDIVVGNSRANGGQGAVYVVDAVQTMDIGERLVDRTALVIEPGGDASSLGEAVAIAADLGIGGPGADIALGAPSSNAGRGAVYLLDINDLPAEITQMTSDAAIGSIVSDDPFHQVGCALAVTDGFGGLPNSQLWIGAGDSSSMVGGGGAVGLFDQSTSLLTGAHTKFGALPGLVEGAVAGGHLGQRLVSGDLDGDARPELLALEPDSEFGAMYILRSMRFHNADADGYLDKLGDCDDTNDQVFPGAEELCDGIDNDCNDEVEPYELDEDSDGWMPCEEPGDCDDSDSDVNPGVPEDCEDGIDNDCDGAKDGEDEECGGSPGDDDDFEPGDDDDTQDPGGDDDASVDGDGLPAGFHCACDSLGRSRSSGAVALLLALVLLRRRR